MLRVSKVAEKSLAHKCGIVEGDMILSINGNKINDLLDYMYYSKDESLVIEYIRDGNIQK
nr:PDZ domain-containing protein [Caldicellulosiruptor bescii]